jgi:C_GCAxxG_C_C family probable redox protein
MKEAKEIAGRAEELFRGGCNCAESVVTALVEGLGVQCSCLPGLATGLGGGIGHTGHVCGAATGAAMAIGLAACRRGLADHNAEKAWANGVVAELIDAFERQFDSTECRELLGLDLREEGWLELYKVSGCKEQCVAFVRVAAQWAAARLAKEGL